MSAKERENTQADTSKIDENSAQSEALLDEAVNASCERKEMSDEDEKTKEVVEEAADAAPEGGDGGSHGGDGASTVDDSDIERAVKAGMPISTVRSFTDKGALQQVVSLLESKRDQASGGGGREDGGKDPVDDDDDIDIPDLENEDEFDPSFVKGYKAMKAVIQKQAGTIKALKAGGVSPGGKDWFDSKVETLGDAYKDALGSGSARKAEQVENLNKVKAKFEVLTAGYKQAKADVSKDEVFSEALKLVVGNVESDAVKAKSLADRAKLTLQRPSSANGKSVSRQSSESIEREIAEEINAKFFGK